MATPRTISYGNPLLTLTPDGACDVSFSWTLPAALGGTVCAVTVHLPVPQPQGSSSAKQVLHDAIRAYIRAHEQGMTPAPLVPAALGALAGTKDTLDLDAVGT